MQTVASEVVLGQLEWRYATKKFDPSRKIPPAHWDTLEKALVLTPSSYGLQPWKFVVVTSQAVKEKLVAASWGQRQPADCSHHVALAIRKNLSAQDIDRHVQRIVEVRGGSKEALAGYRDKMLQSQKQAAAQGTIDHWCARQIYTGISRSSSRYMRSRAPFDRTRDADRRTISWTSRRGTLSTVPGA